MSFYKSLLFSVHFRQALIIANHSAITPPPVLLLPQDFGHEPNHEYEGCGCCQYYFFKCFHVGFRRWTRWGVGMIGEQGQGK